MKHKKQWGGKRKGAGRPKKEPTKTLSYRVPLKDHQRIHELMKQLINSLNK